MANTNTNSFVRVKSDVLCTELADGSAVLLHLGPNSCCTINQTGLWMWRHFEPGSDLASVTRHAESHFKIDRAHAERSVLTFVDALTKAGVVESSVTAIATKTSSRSDPAPWS